MNILFITILLPYPIDCGAQYKTHQILMLLSKHNKIDYVSLIDDYNELVYSEKLKDYCQSYRIFFSPVINSRNKLLFIKLLLSIFHYKPFIVFKYYSKEMRQYVYEISQQKKFDLIYIDHINMAQYIPRDYLGKVIYDEHNISSIAFSVLSRNENNPLLKLIYYLESWKLRLFENLYLDRFDHIFTISKLDREKLLLENINPNKVSHLPVPFQAKNLYSYNVKNLNITFIGLLSWMPNLKGIIWFIVNVYPHIKRSIPSIRLRIVGKTGNELMKFLKRLADKNIIYEGFLMDLDKLYKKTSVVIIPIQEGGGIRIKLLDALSHGMPVVSTTLGAEGIPVTSGKDILIADDPHDFAEAVISIIKNKEIARRLSENGYQFVKKYYNEDNADKLLTKILKNL